VTVSSFEVSFTLQTTKLQTSSLSTYCQTSECTVTVKCLFVVITNNWCHVLWLDGF